MLGRVADGDEIAKSVILPGEPRRAQQSPARPCSSDGGFRLAIGQGGLRGMSTKFPDGFLWGTATAAHQVEGGNTASDLWLMEMMKDSLFAEPSGDACDHYHRYAADIAMLKALGFGVYRFSIEWARIEPEEGFFSKAALDHYRRMIAACLAEGIVPMVTFHHFTAPLWFTRDGGWENEKSVDRFARYCERAGKALGDLIPYTCTINEANIPIMVTMIREAVGVAGGGGKRIKALAEAARLCGGEAGRFSPYLSGDGHAMTPNLIAAHRKAYGVLKPLVAGPVGITLSLNEFQAEPGGEALRDAADHAINGQFPGKPGGRRFHRRADLYPRALRREHLPAASARRRSHADGIRVLSRGAGSLHPARPRA